MKIRLAALIFVLLGPALALAEEPFDAIWAHADLYENPGNPVIQGLELSGRAQGEWAWVDADQGDFDDTLWRRFRFGFKADIARAFVVHVEGDFDFNEKLESSYERLTDAYLRWQAGDRWTVKALKQSAGFTLDGYTSSKYLLTPERNNLTNNLWFTAEYFTGATVAGDCAEGWTCKAGVFSSEGSPEISTLDAGYFTYLSAGYDLGPRFGQEKLLLQGFYIYNDEDEDANTRKFTHVLSLMAQWEQGPWGLWADLTAGDGYDSQSDLFGAVAMPFYNFTPRQQLVGRLTWLKSEDDNGVRLNRYERDVVSGRGDEYREAFLGFNWFFYGHKLKWQTGLQYAEMDDSDTGDGDYEGWGLTTALRISW
jgi:phosphate-selective porin OprO/OprP